MTLTEFDRLTTEQKIEVLHSCCGSSEWVKSMIEILPVENIGDMVEYAEEKWYECTHCDWLEAIENHARLGDSQSLLMEDVPYFGKMEQRKLFTADAEVLDQLTKTSKEYEEIFGYMFISFASGKSGEELLAEIDARLNNDPREEIKIAADEQNKITIHRLRKLFAPEEVTV